MAGDFQQDLIAGYEQTRKDRDWSVEQMTEYLATLDPVLSREYAEHHGDDVPGAGNYDVGINAATSDPGTDARDTAIVATVGEPGVNNGSGPAVDAVGTGAQAPEQVGVPGTNETADDAEGDDGKSERKGARKRTAAQPEKQTAAS